MALHGKKKEVLPPELKLDLENKEKERLSRFTALMDKVVILVVLVV